MEAVVTTDQAKAVKPLARQILDNLPGIRLDGLFLDMKDRAYLIREAALKESARDVMEMVEPKAPRWKGDAAFLAAVIRDVSEHLPDLQTLVVVGIYTDGSTSVWQSETPMEIERAAVVLMRFAQEHQGGFDDSY